MNKDEILAKSREENKNADERQLALRQKAQAISGAVGIALCFIIALLEGVFGDSVILFYGCFSIYWGMTAANGIALAVATKKKFAWFSLLNAVFFAVFMAKLILELI